MMRRISVFCSVLMLLFLLASCAGQPEAPANIPADSSAAAQLIGEADALYAAESYGDALEKYLSAMEQDIKNMDARLGIARCQTALGNYALAADNLSVAAQIQPDSLALCEAYAQLSLESGTMHYAQIAIELADTYQITDFLERVPAAPVLTVAPGKYDEKISVGLTCDDPDAELYISCYNNSGTHPRGISGQYTEPLLLSRGVNSVSGYVVKDGIPSADVFGEYTVSYPETEVFFREPIMEMLVKESIGKPAGPITNYDCETVTNLDWYSLQNYYDDYYDFETQAQISSLEDLAYFPNLEMVDIANQTAKLDYSALRNCKHLSYCDIEYCTVTDLSFVRDLPELVQLRLYDDEIANISPLENLSNVLYLDLSSKKCPDITNVLLTNPQLLSIEFYSSSLPDLNILKEMPNLVVVRVHGIKGLNTAVLAELTDLESLCIQFDYDNREYSNTYLDDLSFLDTLTNLQVLYLNGVRDPAQLDHLMGLPNLTTLYLYSSDVTKNQAAMDQLTSALPRCTIRY